MTHRCHLQHINTRSRRGSRQKWTSNSLSLPSTSTQNHEEEDDDNGQNSLSTFFLSLEQHQHTTRQGLVANVLGWVCSPLGSSPMCLSLCSTPTSLLISKIKSTHSFPPIIPPNSFPRTLNQMNLKDQQLSNLGKPES